MASDTIVAPTLFSQPPKARDSLKISASSRGTWMVFEDSVDCRIPMNSPRPRSRDPKVLYRHRPYRQREPPPAPDPLIVPVFDNYFAFRPRRRLCANRAPRPRQTDPLGAGGRAEGRGGFHGDEPSRWPFRRSTILTNERRSAEVRPPTPKAIETPKAPAPPKAPADPERRRPSLYRRMRDAALLQEG
jgi:hypothetical protein